MISLDNVNEIKKLDQSNILENIIEFPDQLEKCWHDWQSLALPTSFIQAKNIILCGVGGSGIGASIAYDLGRNAKIPIIVWKDYNLPGFANKDSLVICTSYSGNTEETISSLKEASKITNKIVTISTGGKIASLATNYRNPHYKIDYGADPRSAIGYTFTSILSILVKLGFIELSSNDFKEALLLLRGTQKKIDINSPLSSNNAKLLAKNIYNKIPIIIGSEYLIGVATRFKQQFNENSKNAAYFETIPEMNHNSLVGLQFPKELRSKIFVVILQSKFDNPRNRLRQSITGQIFDRYGIHHEFIMLEPVTTPFSEIIQVIHFGDFVSYYLAILNEIDPTPVNIVHFLKDKLDEKPI